MKKPVNCRLEAQLIETGNLLGGVTLRVHLQDADLTGD